MEENEDTENKSSGSSSQVEDDVSSDDEVKPELKYRRLGNDVQRILRTDSISCVFFHPKIICLGTRAGAIYIFDHQGNIGSNELLKSHPVTVNQISMDAKGDFIASCSEDGTVYVYCLHDRNHQIELMMGHCVKSVAIDPYYYKLGGNRRFITGDKQLILHERKFSSRVKSTVLCNKLGRVHNIKWHNQFVAWAIDTEVHVFDIIRRTSLECIKWDRSNDFTPESFPCCLNWEENATLMIGWVDKVHNYSIKKHTSMNRGTAEFIVTPIWTIQLEYFISSVCPFEGSRLIALVHEKEKDENGKSWMPLMCFIKPGNPDFDEMHKDSLQLRGYQDCCYSDCHLEYLVMENLFLITSPKDVVIAGMFDHKDHINWLVKHKKFEEAMQIAVTKDCQQGSNSLLDIGRKYIDHLFSENKYDKAGEVCAKILGNNKTLWEIEIWKFAERDQLRAVYQHLPDSSSCKLDPKTYEMVLKYHLKNEPQKFLKIVKQWSPSLYNVPAMIDAVTKLLIRDTQHQKVLLESLAILYTYSGQYNKALNTYLKLKHKDVFQLISAHNLYPDINDNIKKLMKLDAMKTIALLRDNKRISPDVIVSCSQYNDYYLYLYLDALDKNDHQLIGRKYHTQLVKLYAQFAPTKLLPLLRRSDSYSIHEALTICKKWNLYQEMVYLHGRMGNTKEALQLLVKDIKDIKQAFVFCKEHDDKDLWEDLVQHALPKPEFVTYLLNNISPYADPLLLLKRIDNHTPIPELKNALVKMLYDSNQRKSIEESCKNITESDFYDLQERLMVIQRNGFAIDDDTLCSICNQNVLDQNKSKGNVVVFYCRHSFHEGCLPSGDTSHKCKCIICCSQKGGLTTT